MDVQKLLNIEKKYNLYDCKVKNVNYWIYHRFELWNYNICAKSLGLNTSYKNKPKKILEKIKPIKYFFNKKISSNIDVLFLNHERRIKNDEYYDCIYTEELSSYYSNGATIENSFQRKHFRPTRTKNLYYTDRILFCASLFSKIYKKICHKEYKNICLEINKQMREPLKEISKAFNWDYNEKELINMFANTVVRNQYIYKKYFKIVKRLNPKVIIEVVSYSSSKMIFNEIAKELNIPVIELQHGTIYNEHLAYQYNTNKVIKQFPDKIFLFSDFWKNNLNPPIPKENLITTGYPFFDSKIAEYKKNKTSKNKKTILFISQGTIGLELSKLACELDRKLDSNEYRIIFKLHPSECINWKDTYKELYDSKIEVIDNNNESIYYYFNESDIQIGAYSTALYEGIGFGLKTLIYKVGHYDIMEPLVEKKYAKYIENVTDIIKILKQKNNEKNNNSQEFWKSDSLNNMIKYISEYIKNDKCNIKK